MLGIHQAIQGGQLAIVGVLPFVAEFEPSETQFFKGLGTQGEDDEVKTGDEGSTQTLRLRTLDEGSFVFKSAWSNM